MSIKTEREIALNILRDDLHKLESTARDLLLLNKEADWNIVVFRYLLPEIESLGKYLQGEESSSENAVSFIKNYFAKIDPLYLERGSFLWAVFRHGLIHNGKILKLFKYKGKNIGVGYGFSGENHLQLETGETCTFYVSTKRLIEDTIKAYELYIEDLENNDDLVQKFTSGFWIRVQGEWKIDDGSDSLDLEKYISRNLKWINLSDVVFLC